MQVFTGFEAVKRAVGAQLGVSDWVVVSQERIDRFAEATGDDQFTSTSLAPVANFRALEPWLTGY